MRKLITLLFLLVSLCAMSLKAELITSTPAIIQQNSTGIVIKFKASEGNAGLRGTTTCYAHTGVITNKSASDSDWQYAPTWGDNSDKYKLKLTGTNTWSLTIGDIRSYYGITDPTEKVLKLAFVFRNKDCSKEGKTEDGGDILVNVYEDGLAVSLTSNAGGNVISGSESNVTFTVTSTLQSNLKLFLNDVNSTPIATADNATTLSHTYNFPIGDYQIIAQAENNGTTVSESKYLCHRNNSAQQAYSGTLKQGATANADGTVTFCLYAPDKSNVMLVGEWNDYRPMNSGLMNYQGNKYFWTTVSGLDMDKEYGYYFIVDDNINVADPYAKLVLDPFSDKYINEKANIYPNLKSFPTNIGNFVIAVFHGNENKYNWEVNDFKAPAKDNLVIYELLFRDFTDERSVNAALEKLDYLKSLGINAIELMPIQEFDGNNSWGYNPNFYFAPDKAYGTKADYKRFIDECHKKGIAVILDVVFNHSWGVHPWCRMYWDAANGRPASNNPFYNAVAPHNWSVGNDFKQENMIVQQYFKDVLQYWIKEYKVDGYRFDLAKGLGESSSYSSDYDASSYNSSRVGIMKGYTNAIRTANPNAYCIYEYFVASSEESEMGNYGGMSWSKQITAGQQACGGYSSNSSFMGMVDKQGYKVNYMESHDEERTAFWQKSYAASGIKGNTAVSMRRLGANAAFCFLAPGAKMIWQFGEMGYDVALGTDSEKVDPKPTHWEYLQNNDRKGLVQSYSEIINIRTANPDLFSSAAEFYMNANTSDWDNGRFITARNKATGKQLVAVWNPTTSDKTFNYTFDNVGGKYYINSKSYGTNPSFNSSTGKISVPAHGYVVITNMEDPSGVEDVVADNDNTSISVYPNPATDYVMVNNADVTAIEVYSLSGQIVARTADSNTITVADLAKGSYILRATTANGIKTAKFIKY
ncbi:MAG: alpha-amylase family glycosyl hydrolase [Muribaculaceae bacterium]|nr:alpha-amylase family glycosyl hydrolase [Muribaculaceae bacterium]